MYVFAFINFISPVSYKYGLHILTPQGNLWHTMVKGAKKVKAGNKFRFPDGSVGTIIEHENDKGSEFRTIQFESRLDDDWFGRNGHIPLPPYIRREDDDTDSERYQTVYAKETALLPVRRPAFILQRICSAAWTKRELSGFSLHCMLA